MMKIWILLLFTCVCVFSQAQVNNFNKTLDYKVLSNGLGSISLYNEDTLIVDGTIWDASGSSKKCVHFVNCATGDSIKSYLFGKNNYLYGSGASQSNIIRNDMIYVVSGAQSNDSLFPSFHKISLDGNMWIDSIYFPLNHYSRFDCIIPINDGNFFIVGSKEVSFGNLDAWLVKMDPFGNILSEQTYGDSGVDGALKIMPYDQNSFLIAAYSDRDGLTKSKIWIKKIDLSGNTIWDKYFDGEDYDGALIEVLQDSNIIIYGVLSTIENVNALPFVMKLNSEGDEIWRYFPSPNLFLASMQNTYNGLVENSDHSLTLIGSKWDVTTSNTIGFIQKLSEEGDSLWYRELSIRNNENYLTALKLLNNGDFLMAGYVFADSPDNTEDGWIMRTNCLGYFEHPKDSIVFGGSGSNILSMTNYSSFYEYTIVDWGDNSSDTLYESGNQNLVHEYSVPGNYIINSTIIACNDTIQIQYEYLVTPEQYGTSDLVIFPNPNNGEFEIWLDSPELYSLEIIDMNGRILKRNSEVSFNTSYPIDLSEFESSVYFVRAISGEKSFQKRVVIMN